MTDYQKARAAGYGFVCAMCDKLRVSVDANACLAQRTGRHCTGPFGGGAFPEYRGPLKGRLHTVCFVCGETANAAVAVADGVSSGASMVGVCSRHVDMLEGYSRAGEPPPAITHKHLEVADD